MVTKVCGELDDWGDGDLGGNDFMKLEEGSNVVRVFTKPYQFYIVWTNDATGKQRKIRSAVKNCPLVQRGEEPSARWYVGVLDRRNGARPAILEMGPQIYKQILGLHKKNTWGDPRAYDIDIERKPKGSQPLYIVSPEPKSALKDDEIAKIKEFRKRVDLVKMTEAPTPEEVREQLGISEPDVQQVDNEFDDFKSDSTDDTDDFDFSNV